MPQDQIQWVLTLVLEQRSAKSIQKSYYGILRKAQSGFEREVNTPHGRTSFSSGQASKTNINPTFPK